MPYKFERGDHVYHVTVPGLWRVESPDSNGYRLTGLDDIAKCLQSIVWRGIVVLPTRELERLPTEHERLFP